MRILILKFKLILVVLEIFLVMGFDVTILEDENPDYFVCISPTEEERNKRGTEVTTLE